MKKTFQLAIAGIAITIGAMAMTGCSYDDNDLWNAIDGVNGRIDTIEQKIGKMNDEINALGIIVNALDQNLSISSITETPDGYEIIFSDGSKAHIYHGKNGTNGTDGKDGAMPEISVAKDTDGNYYWTVNGEWLIINGEKIRANGIDGKDGKDGKDGNNGTNGSDGDNAIAPQIRINPQTNEWEISIDGGKTWTSTGVNAGSNDTYSCLFTSVKVEGDYVTFVTVTGVTFTVPLYDATLPIFTIQGVEDGVSFLNGESLEFEVTEKNVVSYAIQKPDGWKVAYMEGKLNVTAPAEANIYAEREGRVSIIAVSENNKSIIADFNVKILELRVLTFEDKDARFSSYSLDYCGMTISKWSDLIDSKQYGGELLYGPDDSGWGGMGMDEPYWWYDEGNTELMHVMPEAWGMYCFWSGGHAISNYASSDISAGGPSTQLTINGVQGRAGHNGSANFAVQFGYIDDGGFNMTSELPALEFYDGKDRVISHMYVMPTNYALNCYTNGNSLTSKLGPDDYVKIYATGYTSSGQKTGTVEILLANGNNVVREWTKFELKGLGKVARVEFNILGTNNNGYGFSQPAYFAYDDVTVIWED